MLTEIEIQQAIKNLHILIKNFDKSARYFSINCNQLSKNIFFKSRKEETKKLNDYLQQLVDDVSNPNADFDNRSVSTLFITLQNFLHLKPNQPLQDLQLNLPAPLIRHDLSIKKLSHYDLENSLNKNLKKRILPEINYDMRTGHYTSPDDNKAHQHSVEARRIFFSTQFARFKGFINKLFAKIGIHVFENARYSEHDYLDSDIYAHDLAIKSIVEKQHTGNHYWIGHSSNFITIPTKASPLHILTDPVEGDLAPFLYPRMTKEASLIDGLGDKKLPKVDVVIISHNHRDHLSISTLKHLVKQQPKMVVPAGDKALFKDLGFENVVELKWWEQAKIKHATDDELLKITAVPVRHWSGRTIGDAHCSAFNGYVLQANELNGDLYFAGDTALMDDYVSQPIFDKFNITTSIQPGGPDERREDMESTHQSSADGMLMHFKILATKYKKMIEKGNVPTLDEFLESCSELKTIYNHTATFRLGNLRLRDTFYSYQRMIAAFQEQEQWRDNHLPKHELMVYEGIQELAQKMIFSDDKPLNNQHIASIILQHVIMPKIGQRQTLHTKKMPPTAFQYRNLITNRRALIEFDAFAENYAKNHAKFDIKEIILNLLNNYQKPWYANFSRSYLKLAPYLQAIEDCTDTDDLLNVLNSMDSSMRKRNQHGHMQSLIHFSKWLIDFSIQHQDKILYKMREFYVCQQIRKTVNHQINNTGGIIIGAMDRKSKQHAFRDLSDKLALASPEFAQYQNIITEWRTTKVNETQSTQQLLSENRAAFFKQDVTHSIKTLKNIELLLGTVSQVSHCSY